MLRKRFSIEQIIHHFWVADALLAQGRAIREVCRRIGVSEEVYYRWRNGYTGRGVC